MLLPLRDSLQACYAATAWSCGVQIKRNYNSYSSFFLWFDLRNGTRWGNLRATIQRRHERSFGVIATYAVCFCIFCIFLVWSASRFVFPRSFCSANKTPVLLLIRAVCKLSPFTVDLGHNTPKHWLASRVVESKVIGLVVLPSCAASWHCLPFPRPSYCLSDSTSAFLPAMHTITTHSITCESSLRSVFIFFLRFWPFRCFRFFPFLLRARCKTCQRA